MTDPIRVVIADDKEKVRAEIHKLVNSQMNMKVIAEVGNGDDAIVCVKELRADILLLDISMPGMNGLQVLKRIRHEHPRTHVVIVSSSTDRDSVEEAQELGAHGYIAKRDLAEELLLAIQRVMGGGSFLSRAVSQERMVSREEARGTSVTATPGKDVTNGQHSNTAGLQANMLDPEPVATVHYEPRAITVFVVEDEPDTIRYISHTLSKERRITLVGLSEGECYQACKNVKTLVNLIEERNPDIVVLDLHLVSHDRGGWQVINELRKKKPQVSVILLTRTVDQHVVSNAWRDGIAGYVPKRCRDEELIPAILTVHSGETYYSPSLGERVWWASPETRKLTSLGRRVFYLVVMDRSTEQITNELDLKPGTVWAVNDENRKRIGPVLGWKDVAKDAQKDPTVLKALTAMERKVFDKYLGRWDERKKCFVEGMTHPENIAEALRVSVGEVKDLIPAIHRKLGCYPGGWKDIARKERAI